MTRRGPAESGSGGHPGSDTAPGTRWRRPWLAPAVLLALITVQGLFLVFTRSASTPPAPVAVAPEPDRAHLTVLVGSVRIGSGDGTRPAVVGDVLRIGDAIATASDARAEIEMPEIGVIHLDAASSLERTAEQGRRFGWHLRAGRMLVQTAAATDAELPICRTPHAEFIPVPGRENEFLVLAEP